MQNRYKYKVFGLIIESELLFSEFLLCEGMEDLKIIHGKTPLKINSNILDEGINYIISKNEFLFNIEDVANYYVKDGNLIVIDPSENADLNTIKAYLISTALGMALLQRGILSLHGSSIVRDNRCVILTGGSGAGKSTLCAALLKKGFKFLADDISVLSSDSNGVPMVQPAFPQQRLCRDSIEMIGYDSSVMPKACKNDDKLLLFANKSFHNKSVPLYAVIELMPKPNCEVSISRIAGLEMLRSFIKNIYFSSFFNRIGLNIEIFKKILSVVKSISYYQLEKPVNRFSVNEQISLIEDIFN